VQYTSIISAISHVKSRLNQDEDSNDHDKRTLLRASISSSLSNPTSVQPLDSCEFDPTFKAVLLAFNAAKKKLLNKALAASAVVVVVVAVVVATEDDSVFLKINTAPLTPAEELIYYWPNNGKTPTSWPLKRTQLSSNLKEAMTVWAGDPATLTVLSKPQFTQFGSELTRISNGDLFLTVVLAASPLEPCNVCPADVVQIKSTDNNELAEAFFAGFI
jgi:hypothetical protein